MDNLATRVPEIKRGRMDNRDRTWKNGQSRDTGNIKYKR